MTMQATRPILVVALLAAMSVPAQARNAEDYWCGKGENRIHLMMWIAKVQEPMRDEEGKLIRDNEGNLSWERAADGRTYSQYGIINHKLPADDPKWVTVVPERWIRFDTENNIYFRGQKCTVFTENDQDKYGVGYYGPRDDLRYPHIKGKIPEVIKPAACKQGEPRCGVPPACKQGEPQCGVPLQKACADPQSGVEFPKGYMCVNDPNKWGWQCEIHDGKFKFYKTKGSGGKRKRDAICE
jgi:hypothetical protein